MMLTTLTSVCQKEVGAIFGYSQHYMGNYSLVYNIIAILVFFCLAFFFFYRKEARKKVISHLMGCAIVVFIFGCALYAVGFWHEGTANNVVAAIFRSVTASMEMFVSESELIEVREECKDDLIYMLLFSATHFLAICISAAFIIHIMGIRFRSYLKMRFARKNQNDIYVFFDLSQEAINLAKDVYKTKGKDGNYQIVFVKTPVEESHLERFSFSHILSFADNRSETIEDLIGINAFLTNSRKSVAIGMDEREWDDTVGLNTLRRYLKKSSGEKLFFCLSSNEDNNVNTAVVLSKRYSNAKKHQIYCRANRNSITESFASLNLNIIDSASLAVLELKKNVAFQPVSFVKPDHKNGIATKPFKAMIIGFGEIGFEAYSFLYEFSAFVGKNIEENPFRCDIIDPKSKQLENSLYIHCPALEEKAHIVFHEGTIESNRCLIEVQIKTVDYIVVCTDNDQENLSIGITLLNLAYKYREHSAKLGIFIGVNNNKEYKKAQEIAKFYNECGKKDKEEHIYEFNMIPFGAKQTLFTYKNIIDNEILDRAKEFYYEYQKTSNLLDASNKYVCAEDKDAEWNKRREDKKQTVELGLSNKNELMQKEAQDMANVWHVQTKLYLVGACDQDKKTGCKHSIEERRKELFKCIDTVMQQLIVRLEKGRENDEPLLDSYEFIQERISEYEQKHGVPTGEYKTLFENLAKCEHLRWNASNRMLGYRTYEDAEGNQKHYLRKTHACMVSNEELIANEKLRDTIKYDYNTIWVSFRLQNK